MANDLILNQRKLGGILTETKISGQFITQAVIGVGLNWENPVPEIGINLQTFFANSATPGDSIPRIPRRPSLAGIRPRDSTLIRY